MRINKLFLLAAITLLCHTGSSGAAVETSRWRQLGSKAFEQGNYEQAIVFLRRYLDESGKDRTKQADAYECIIAACIRASKPQDAEALLKEFDERMPGIMKLKKSLMKADILLLERKYKDAENLYESIMATSIIEGELYFQLLSGLGFALSQQDKWQRAAEVYELLFKAGKNSPWEQKSLKLRIYALIMGGQLQNAANLLKDIDSGGKEQDFNILKLLLLIKNNDYEKFKKFYGRVVPAGSENKPDPEMYKLDMTAAKHFLIANDLDGALMMLKDAYRFSPSSYDRKKTMRALINTYVSAGKKAEAIEVGRKYVTFYKKSPEAIDVSFQIGRLLTELKKYDDAEKCYKDIMADTEFGLNFRILAAKDLSVLFVFRKRYDHAEKALEFIWENGKGEAGKYEGRFLVGKLYYDRDKFAEAEKIFAEIVKNSQTWHDRSLFMQMRCEMNLKKFKEALSLCEKLLSEGKDAEVLRDAAYYKAVILQQLGMIKDARTGYIDFATKYPASEYAPTALFEAGSIAYNDRQFAMASELFADFARKYDKDSRAANALYRSIYSNYLGGKPQIAVTTVKELTDKYPDSTYAVAALLWQSDWLRENKKFDEADKLLQDMQKKYSNDKTLQAQILYERGVIASMQGKSKDANALLKQIFDKYTDTPSAPDAYFLAGDIASKNGEYEEAAGFYARGARLRPDSPLEIACRGRVADCHFVMYNKTLKESFLQSAIAEYKTLAGMHNLSAEVKNQTLYKLGRCYELLKDDKQALVYYSELIFGYDIDHQRDQTLKPVWTVKAAYAAILIYLKADNPEAAEKAIKIYKILQSMDIKTGEDFGKIISEIEAKYKL